MIEPQPKIDPVVKENKKDQETGDLIAICEINTSIIAAIPKSSGTVLTGTVVYYLINNTGQDLIFSFYARQKNNWQGIKYGTVKPGESFELTEYSRESLIDIHSFLFQGSLFAVQSESFPVVIRKEFGVMLPGLQNAKRDVPGLAAFASQVTVIADTNYDEPIVELKDLEAKFGREKKSTSQQSPKPPSFQEKQASRYGILENEKEIDLHIEELVRDFSGMANAEMLQVQMSRFSKEMDTAISRHFKKIVFIHGVGNGKLKNEIRKELRNYQGVAFRDADNRKYGSGATEVIFE